jgi:hypothetical protein
MRRAALAILVALLTFSASGVSTLVIDEPCVAYEQTTRDDGACPPTCLTCGCCTQAIEPVTIHVAGVPEPSIASAQSFTPRIPATRVSDILHVPKRALA